MNIADQRFWQHLGPPRQPMTLEQRVFACALVPLFLGGLYVSKWLENHVPTLEHWKTAEGAASAKFWQGNLAEVFSHWLNMWACSGVFAAALACLIVERAIRDGETCWKGSWTACGGSVFFLWFWLECVRLDFLHGEGVVLATIPMFFIPLIVLSLSAAHIVLSRVRSIFVQIAASIALGLAMYLGQLIFEPSQSGAPNILVLVAIAIAAAMLLPAWRVCENIQRTLREKGYSWVTKKDALFISLNVVHIESIPARDELAIIPEYDDGDIWSLCEIAVQRETIY